jgi:hypothetical protein
MRIRTLARRACGPAAVLIVTAAGMQLAGLPAQAASAPAASRHVAPAARAQRINAQLVLDVQVGASVTIRGGGGGTSNCTDNETDKTVKVTTVPQTEEFGFTTKASGSCFYERSWSNFRVTVRDGDREVASQLLSIDQPGFPTGGYEVFCHSEYSVHAKCYRTEPLRVELTQLVGKGGKRTGRYEAGLDLYVDGPGPDIRVVGGGGGPDHSNCTINETDRTLKATTGDPTRTSVSFDSRAAGSCIYEPSYSYFNIYITGTNAAGKKVDGMGRVFLGQTSAISDYIYRCEPGTANVTCERKDGTAIIRLKS